MSWLGLLGPLGWLVDPVSKGFTEIGKLAADLGASASAQAQADATVKIRRIEARISEAQNAKEIRLATANFLEMRLLTVAVAVPFVAHTWAVALDTTFKFGWGIPKFPAPFDQYEGAILLSFFGLSGATGIFKAIAGAAILATSKK